MSIKNNRVLITNHLRYNATDMRYYKKNRVLKTILKSYKPNEMR